VIIPDALVNDLLSAQHKMLDDWAEFPPDSPDRKAMWLRLHRAADAVRDYLELPQPQPPAHEHTLVGEFHNAFDVPVRDEPDNTTVTKEEQLLRVKLVIEEAFEFADAMGVSLCDGDNYVVSADGIYYEASGDIDLVEAADALADSLYVVYGSAHTLGIPIREVFALVHASNMEKLGPDGKPIYREGDNKVLKPEGWQPPQAKILQLLMDSTVRKHLGPVTM
jgi:predicted HAD superfamily Cof-like phosphohydrolase